MSSTTQTNTSGGSLLGLLTIAFIVLKLTGVIDWSWWWVLAPTWIPAAVFLVILAVMGVLAFIAWRSDRRRS